VEALIRASPKINTIVSLVQPAGFARRCFQVGRHLVWSARAARMVAASILAGLARFEPAPVDLLAGTVRGRDQATRPAQAVGSCRRV
jgi:hypothetical protein